MLLGGLCIWALFVSCSDTPEKTPPAINTPNPPISPIESEIAPFLKRAQQLLAEGKFQEAVTVSQEGLKIDSTSVYLLNIMATSYASEGRYAQQ